MLVLYSPAIRTLFSTFTTAIQTTYLDFKESVGEMVERHFMQVRTIERLHRTNEKLSERLIRFQNDAASYRALKSAMGLEVDMNLSVIPVRTYGYALLGNFQQLWLERFRNYDPEKNYGVIRNGYAIGIVVEEENRPLMILAGDKACNFAVYIGKKRAPGIATGKDARHMIVKYIPEWMKIEIGDRVFTNGLDRIFPMGIEVGKVLSIRKMQGFKNAEIELFGDTLHPDFVWVVNRDR